MSNFWSHNRAYVLLHTTTTADGKASLWFSREDREFFCEQDNELWRNGDWRGSRPFDEEFNAIWDEYMEAGNLCNYHPKPETIAKVKMRFWKILEEEDK